MTGFTWLADWLDIDWSVGCYYYSSHLKHKPRVYPPFPSLTRGKPIRLYSLWGGTGWTYMITRLGGGGGVGALKINSRALEEYFILFEELGGVVFLRIDRLG